ncbi:putative NBD/HSP70 family sugar kinase [Paenibacillus sp. DS2015]|uniref:ROK family protein n=1 Tax=Paenibacillus sp. DS2015 TaxID=3373917 RepID=UPI003D1F4092
MEEGETSIIQKCVEDDPTKITAKIISEAYNLGDSLAINVMHEIGNILGFGLSSVINLLNPEVIIVGGWNVGSCVRQS